MQTTFSAEAITISTPNFMAVQAAPVANDVIASRDHWLPTISSNPSSEVKELAQLHSVYSSNMYEMKLQSVAW